LDVDDEESRDYALRNGVASVPTLVLFADGREVKRVVGFDLEELRALEDLALRLARGKGGGG
jgi:thioredoxin-like negative regulator of GroEL